MIGNIILLAVLYFVIAIIILCVVGMIIACMLSSKYSQLEERNDNTLQHR